MNSVSPILSYSLSSLLNGKIQLGLSLLINATKKQKQEGREGQAGGRKIKQTATQVK
jgi:hypothetical protein